MAIRTITWEVQEDGMSLSPATCQDGGVQGDHNKTRAEFVLPSSLIDGYDFYIECVDVLGEWDTTEKLEVENNRVATLLPLAWTQRGGEATLRLVAAKEGEVGYTLEGRVRYHSRAGLLEKVKTLVDGCIQAMLTRMEAAAEVIENATDAKEVASQALKESKQALEESEEALERVHGTNRIYVGSGEMPEDCNVQIDYTDDTGIIEDYVVDYGTDGVWTYRKWASGIAECWGVLNTSVSASSAWGSAHYYGKLENISFPDLLFVDIPAVSVSISDENGNFFVTSREITAEKVGEIFAVTVVKVETETAIRLNLDVKGRWKE